MTVLDIVVKAENQASQALGAIDDDIDQLSTTAEKTSQSVGKSFTDMGKKMTVRMTLPLLAAGVAAFKLGSDLEESISQSGTVFGAEAGKIIEASENVNDAFSQADFLGFAGNIGDIAQGLGIAQSESDDLALSVIGLGQDLSSFKNVPVDQAVNAITSALTGERESLKSLGIVLKDTDVKQRALELGLWDGVEALSSSAQAQATMSLITEKSANSIGDFDRTSEGAANKSRILAANVKDMAASFGTKLLPIGEKILSWLNKLVGFFTNLPGPVQNVILVVAGLAAALGPMLLIVGKVATLMGPGGALVKGFSVVGKAFGVLTKIMMANPWILLAAAVIAIVVLIVMNWDKIVAFFKEVWEIIKKGFQVVADFLSDLWDTISENVLEVWNTVIDFFKELPGKVMDAIASFATTIFDFIIKWHPVAILWRAVRDVWPSVWSWLKGVPRKVISGLAGLATTVLNWIVRNHPIAILFRKVKAIWPQVRSWFAGIPARILSSLGQLGSLLFNVGKSILDGLLNGLKNTWRKVSGWIGGLGSKIRNLKGPASVDRTLLTENGMLVMDSLLNGLQRAWPRVAGFMSSRATQLSSDFDNMLGDINGDLSFASTPRARPGNDETMTLMRKQNDLLAGILDKTGFSVDGRDLATAIAPGLTDELRTRIGDASTGGDR